MKAIDVVKKMEHIVPRITISGHSYMDETPVEKQIQELRERISTLSLELHRITVGKLLKRSIQNRYWSVSGWVKYRLLKHSLDG